MSRISYPNPKRGEQGLLVLVGKPTREQEREFYRITSGFVSYFRGSKPALGSPQSPGQDQALPTPGGKAPRERESESSLKSPARRA
jgi:hypothetical protein